MGITELLKQFVALLRDLMRPGNWPFLVAFVVVLLVAGGIIVSVVVSAIQQERFNFSTHIWKLWIHLYGGKDDPKEVRAGFRKLLYVQVNLLGDREAMGGKPFYVRKVGRLREGQQLVPVFDEGVYTTLKLYPQKRDGVRERDVSDGVVDGRLVIPWVTEIRDPVAEARGVPGMTVLESAEKTDTMMVVAHFVNGLQGSEQSFSTMADEDAETLRLVVDFSSVPDAETRVRRVRAVALKGDSVIDSDAVRKEECGGGIWMMHMANAGEGTMLKMTFTIGAGVAG